MCRTLNSKAAQFETTGESNQPTSLELCTDGVQAISLIIESLDGDFNGQFYSIFVSNDKIDWTEIYRLNLGFDKIIGNSFTYNGSMNSVLFFRFVKFLVPVKSRIVASLR